MVVPTQVAKTHVYRTRFVQIIRPHVIDTAIKIHTNTSPSAAYNHLLRSLTDAQMVRTVVGSIKFLLCLTYDAICLPHVGYNCGTGMDKSSNC